MALERHRKSTAGVLVDSIRGGGGAATAKLPLQSDDVILQVDGQAVDNVAALKKLTAKLVEGKTERVPVLVQFERDTKQLLTVVKIGQEENKNRPASAAKPWSSLATQVLTSDLAESLDMAGQARRSRHRGLQGAGRRQGRRQGGRHHPGGQRPQSRRLAARRPRGLRHHDPPAFRWAARPS